MFQSVIVLLYRVCVCVCIYNLFGILATEFYFPYVQLFCVPEQFIHILKHLKTAQTHALLCQRGCPPLTYSLCPKLKASALEKNNFLCQKGNFFIFLFVCLFTLLFIQSLLPPFGVLLVCFQLKWKSHHHFCSLCYTFSELWLFVRSKWQPIEQKKHSDSNSVFSANNLIAVK